MSLLADAFNALFSQADAKAAAKAAEVKANDTVRVVPLPGNRYLVRENADGTYTPRVAPFSYSRTVELVDFAETLKSLYDQITDAETAEHLRTIDIRVGELLVTARLVLPDLTVTVAANLVQSRAFAGLGPNADNPLSSPERSREFVRKITVLYRDAFRSPAEFDRFRAAFRNVEASRKAAASSNATGYDNQVVQQVKTGAAGDSLDAWEFLTLSVPVFADAIFADKRVGVDLVLIAEPDGLVFGYETAGDSWEQGLHQGRVFVKEYLDASLAEVFGDAFTGSVVLGEGTDSFASVAERK